MDYKKVETTTNGYISPTKIHQQPVYHQKPSMVPKSEEDLNLGKVVGIERQGVDFLIAFFLPI